jgi:ABC-2 type transport system ATP-binding protein
MSVISLQNVTKQFKGNVVLESVSFDVEEGNTYAVVGPNGSGKSVLLLLSCGLLTPESGTVRVDPRYLSGNRTFPERFGISINGPAYLANRTAEQNLLQLASIRNAIGLPEIRNTLDRVGLSPRPRQKVSTFSMGMKQKLALAQALMEDPDVLLLDEPFNALDQESSLRITTILGELKAMGKTIVFTTHSSQDVEELSDHVLEIADSTVRPAS